MDKQKITIYELCKGGSCCPVLEVNGDGVIAIKEGEVSIVLEKEHLENLRAIIDALLDNSNAN